MFEHIKQELIPVEIFCLRMTKYFFIATAILIIGLIPGVFGFVLVGDLSFVQALINAISVLGTVDLPYPLSGASGQIFTGLYGLFIETVFFVALGTLVAPFVHRAFHRLHLIESASAESA